MRGRIFSAISACIGWFVATSGGACAQSWDDIVKAAEQEGAVTVIGPPVASHRQTLLLFQKAYPKIKLELSGMAPGQYEPRLDAEKRAGQHLWDIMVTGVSSTVYSKQIPDGWYDPVRDVMRGDIKRDELWIGGVDSNFFDKEKRYVFAFTGYQIRGVFINRAQVPESEFNKLSDLLDPKWKGKILWYDPRDRGPGSYFLSQFYAVFGPEKTRWLLQNQEPVLSKIPRHVAEWAVRGVYPIVLGPGTSDIIAFQEQGIGRELVALNLPPEQAAVTSGWGTLLKFSHAPHPKAATVFINWLLGKEAQTDWSGRASVNSLRKDVPGVSPETAVDEKTWLTGLNFNLEKNGGLRLKSIELARDVLK